MILFVLTMIVISLSVISIRIQKNNKIQKKTFEQSQIKSDAQYSSIGVYFQGGRTLVKCLDCAELISLEANVCKHCRANVERHVTQVQEKLIQFEKEREELAVKQKAEDLTQFKKFGLGLVIILPVIIGIVIVAPILKQQFFPTLIEKLASEYKIVLSQCSFDDVEITIDNQSNDDIKSGRISAIGYFKSTAESKRCLTDGLNNAHENFNKKYVGDLFFDNKGLESYWFIGNWKSGTWDNGYAGPEEIYTLTNEWRELNGYVTGN
jgi:uncharacterized membrane protein